MICGFEDGKGGICRASSPHSFPHRFRYQCSGCEFSLGSKASLKKHYALYHELFTCEQCSTQFTQRSRTRNFMTQARETACSWPCERELRMRDKQAKVSA